MQLLIQNARLRGRDGTVDIQIENGRIKRIAPKIEGVQGEIIDARGKLTTPSLIDPHIHLDKVNVFDVVRPNKSGTLKEAIEILWDQKRIYTIDDIVARGEDVVKKAIKNGTLAIRTHVDVDTSVACVRLKAFLRCVKNIRTSSTFRSWPFLKRVLSRILAVTS